MNSASIMKRKSIRLARSYQAALHRYLQQPSAAALQPALRLGRRAVALGLETLDLALVHEQALLARILPNGPPSAQDQMIKRAGVFFAEAITPLEETHRAALAANVHLGRLNRTLSQRTLELAASNHELKKEILQRQTAEQNLRQSEQHYRELLEQSRRLQEQLRHLSRRILSAQEEERKRISRELHDVIAQTLTGINVRLATLKTEATASTKGLSQNISRTQRLVEKSVSIIHRFARELRPAVLDDLGLVPALHSHMKDFTKQTGLRIHFTTFTSGAIEGLGSAEQTALYRVAQEALANVAKHAQASRVEVTLQKLPRALCMAIKDNGKSFEVGKVLHARKYRRLGLLGMRERVEMVAGKFAVESASGQGTTIQAQVPLVNGQRGGRKTC